MGTRIEAVYRTDNPDCLPLGDLAGYLVLLLVANPGIRFSFRYKMDENEFSLELTVPGNTSETVVLPVASDATVTESGKPITEIEGVEVVGQDNNGWNLIVGSGNYQFLCR